MKKFHFASLTNNKRPRRTWEPIHRINCKPEKATQPRDRMIGQGDWSAPSWKTVIFPTCLNKTSCLRLTGLKQKGIPEYISSTLKNRLLLWFVTKKTYIFQYLLPGSEKTVPTSGVYSWVWLCVRLLEGDPAHISTKRNGKKLYIHRIRLLYNSLGF